MSMFKDYFIDTLAKLINVVVIGYIKEPFRVNNNGVYKYDPSSKTLKYYNIDYEDNSTDFYTDIVEIEIYCNEVDFNELLEEQLTLLTQWFEINFDILISSSNYTNEYKNLQLRFIDLELNKIFARVTKSLEIQFPALKETHSSLNSYLSQRKMLFDSTAILSTNNSHSIDIGSFIHKPDIIKKVTVRNTVLGLLKDSKLVDKETKVSTFETILSGKSTEKINWMGNVAELRYFANQLQKHNHFEKGTNMYKHTLNYFSALNSQGKEVTHRQLNDAGEPRENIKAYIDLIIKTIKIPPSIKNKLEK